VKNRLDSKKDNGYFTLKIIEEHREFNIETHIVLRAGTA
jgi:hypothetical protein